MQQPTIEQRLEQANADINKLKVRTFDLQETLNAERQSFGQFCGILAQQLGLEGEDAQNLQSYVDAVQALVEPATQAEEEAE